ncbi:aquaporin-2-like [Petaurus breviceps papuanus]|uniref:aquaporin-2-like n=1 Tax=Petaurus breviceps papuanus TaxID=3040969 RepID=UPI0036DB8459
MILYHLSDVPSQSIPSGFRLAYLSSHWLIQVASSVANVALGPPQVQVAQLDLKSWKFWKAVLAEGLGTLIFVGVVLGASCPSRGSVPGITPDPLQPALAGGLVVVALVQVWGEVSGAQTNPALTLALLCARRLDLLRGAAFILAQSTGAILASSIFYLVLPQTAVVQLVTRVSSGGHAGQALGMEFFSTFQLILTVFAVTDQQQQRETSGLGSLAVGFSVTAGTLAAGTFSGGSMNPARSLGPAVVTGIWDDHWAYWMGPILGAILAGLSFEFFFSSGASQKKLVVCVTCRDVEMVEAANMSPSSVSTAT